MKWAIYLAAFAVALLAPVKKTDVGKLQPVEVVYLYMEEGIVIETDTGDIGRGNTVSEALENLKQATPGIVYLDTAEYLLLDKKAEGVVERMKEHLEGSVKVCYLEGDVDLAAAAKYLTVHPPEKDLESWNEAGGKQCLRSDGVQMKLEGK